MILKTIIENSIKGSNFASVFAFRFSFILSILFILFFSFNSTGSLIREESLMLIGKEIILNLEIELTRYLLTCSNTVNPCLEPDLGFTKLIKNFGIF